MQSNNSRLTLPKTPRPLAAASPAPRAEWDAIIVGAGFAGLSAARAAALRGLRVLVLERLEAPGARVRTTGLLCPDSLALLAPSASVLAPRLDALRICGPGLGREQQGCSPRSPYAATPWGPTGPVSPEPDLEASGPLPCAALDARNRPRLA